VPSITIRDDLKAEIVSASPHLGNGFGKYFKGQSASLLADAAVVGQLRKPLRLADPGETGLGLKWSDSMALGNDGPALTIDAGAKALIGVFNRPGKEIFENTFIGAPFKVPSGSGLVSFSISPSLSAGLKKKVGSLSFGFTASSETEIRYLHPFDLTGEELTLADACQTVLEQFVVPNTSDDLRQMRPLPPHAFACVSGQGQLQIAAAVNVAAAFNPLASVDTLPKLGKLEVTGAANATVGVKAALSGGYQIRVQKMEGARVRLSYHTTAGRGLEVSVAATAGLGVTLKDKDLLALFFSGPGGIPGAVKEDLVQGGITAKQLDRVAIALKAGLSRKIELAVAASLSLSKQEDAAFLYEIDLDALDATGAKALDSALAGDLSELNLLEDNASAHGIEVLTSKTQTLRKRKVSWRINLVGIVNVLSMRELVRTGSIAHDEESGEVVVTDKITNDHVGAISTSKLIRKLLYESTLMTLSYKAAGLDVNETMRIDQSFFFFDKSANRQRGVGLSRCRGRVGAGRRGQPARTPWKRGRFREGEPPARGQLRHRGMPSAVRGSGRSAERGRLPGDWPPRDAIARTSHGSRFLSSQAAGRPSAVEENAGCGAAEFQVHPPPADHQRVRPGRSRQRRQRGLHRHCLVGQGDGHGCQGAGRNARVPEGAQRHRSRQ
jgi:hypothetical protein